MALKKPTDPALLPAYYLKLNAKRRRKQDRKKLASPKVKAEVLTVLVGADFLKDVAVSPHGPFRPVEEYGLGVYINDVEVL